MNKEKPVKSEEQVQEVKNKHKRVKKDKQEKIPVAPKPKRFACYQSAFIYYINFINFKCLFENTKEIHYKTPYRAQREWLRQILEDTLKRQNWTEEIYNEDTKELLSSKRLQRTSFTNTEIQSITSWDTLDEHIRMIVNKVSYLSRHQRDYLIDVFRWIDNFVAKEGEEITMYVTKEGKVEYVS